MSTGGAVYPEICKLSHVAVVTPDVERDSDHPLTPTTACLTESTEQGVGLASVATDV